MNRSQNSDVQEQPLREMVAARGWTLHRVYSDRASEGAAGLPAVMIYETFLTISENSLSVNALIVVVLAIVTVVLYSS